MYTDNERVFLLLAKRIVVWMSYKSLDVFLIRCIPERVTVNKKKSNQYFNERRTNQRSYLQ